jgi:hypothetical protein
MSGRSATRLLRSFRQPGEQHVGPSHLNATHCAFDELLHWARPDFDSSGQCHNGCTALGRPECPAVGEPAQALGQALNLVGKCPCRIELDDPLDEGIAADLDSPGGADRVAAVIEDARVVEVVRPRTDRAEVRENIPDLLRVGRDGAAAVNVGHRLRVRGEKVDCAKSPGLEGWEGYCLRWASQTTLRRANDGLSDCGGRH